MDNRLARLISNYQASVRAAVELMQHSGIQMPQTNIAWAANGIPKRGELEGGVPYFKHGYGCAIDLPSGQVDFDFGERGEVDGFDVWRLVGFAGSRLQEYGFANEASLNECFKAEVVAGSLVHSAYRLHYIANAP